MFDIPASTNNIESVLQELETTTLGAPLAAYVRSGEVTISIGEPEASDALATYNARDRNIIVRNMTASSVAHELRHHYQKTTLQKMGLCDLWDVSPSQLYALSHLQELDAFVHQSLITLQLMDHHVQQGNAKRAFEKALEYVMFSIPGVESLPMVLKDDAMNMPMVEMARTAMQDYMHQTSGESPSYKTRYDDDFLSKAEKQIKIMQWSKKIVEPSVVGMIMSALVFSVSLPLALNGSFVFMSAVAANALLAGKIAVQLRNTSPPLKALSHDNDPQVLLPVMQLWGQLPDGSNYLVPDNDARNALVLPTLPNELAERFNALSYKVNKSWLCKPFILRPKKSKKGLVI